MKSCQRYYIIFIYARSTERCLMYIETIQRTLLIYVQNLRALYMSTTYTTKLLFQLCLTHVPWISFVLQIYVNKICCKQRTCALKREEKATLLY